MTWEGALVLLYSLMRYGNVRGVPCIVLVTEDVSQHARSALEQAGWEVGGTMTCDTARWILFEVEALESSHPGVVEKRWRRNLTKLHLWKFSQFTQVLPVGCCLARDTDQILFLDADTVVLNALDEAWECRAELCAVCDAWLPVYFNTGVMVLRPGEHTAKLLEEEAPRLAGEESEQTAFNVLFYRNWQPMDPGMNLQKHKGMTPTRFEAFWQLHKDDIRVLHYFGQKPWLCSREKDCMRHTEHYHHEAAYKVWWRVFDELCSSELVDCKDPREVPVPGAWWVSWGHD